MGEGEASALCSTAPSPGFKFILVVVVHELDVIHKFCGENICAVLVVKCKNDKIHQNMHYSDTQRRGRLTVKLFNLSRYVE